MSSIRTMCPTASPRSNSNRPKSWSWQRRSAGTSGSYAYFCRTCERVTVAAVSPAAFRVLVIAGAALPGCEPKPRPVPSARRLTVDDLIDFHELLNSADWFARLQRPS